MSGPLSGPLDQMSGPLNGPLDHMGERLKRLTKKKRKKKTQTRRVERDECKGGGIQNAVVCEWTRAARIRTNTFSQLNFGLERGKYTFFIGCERGIVNRRVEARFTY